MSGSFVCMYLLSIDPAISTLMYAYLCMDPRVCMSVCLHVYEGPTGDAGRESAGYVVSLELNLA